MEHRHPSRWVAITAGALSLVACELPPRLQAPQSLNSQVCVERSLRRTREPSMLPLAFAEFTKACAGGEHSACSSLGVMYELGLATSEDHARAAKLYQSACAAQNIGGCTNLGLAYLHGIGMSADVPKAKQLLEWSCKREHPVACRELGAMHLLGEGVDVDANRAVTYYRLACKANDGDSCYNLGALFEQGTSVREDIAQAIGYYEQGCVQGEARACDGLTRVQTIRETPWQREAPTRRLATEDGCDAGKVADCASAGYTYFRGEGVKRDVKRAVELLQRACSGGYDTSCTMITPMLQGSCAKGHGDACEALQQLDRVGQAPLQLQP